MNNMSLVTFDRLHYKLFEDFKNYMYESLNFIPDYYDCKFIVLFINVVLYLEKGLIFCKYREKNYIYKFKSHRGSYDFSPINLDIWE